MTGSPDHSTSAKNVADIHDIVVGLDVDSKPLLFILVGADGSINRIGSGNFQNKNLDMFIGMTDPAIFEGVRSQVTEEILQDLGRRFKLGQEVRGAPCKLTLFIRFNNGKTDAAEYLYGSESQGPSSYVANFVRAARRESEEWYQQQLRMVSDAR